MNRIRTIDFLRGMAVILVLFRHHDFFEPLNKAGWIGVDLFFVLSGYLVSSLLFNEYVKSGNVKPIRFLIRRGFKIYPLFYLAIILTVFIESFGTSEILTTYNVTSELFFVQNYFGQLWNHTWSLAVEEHFYIGLAIFLYLAIYSKQIENKKVMMILFANIQVVCLLLRMDNSHTVYSHSTHLIPTHIRMDSLIFGVALSYLHIFNKVNFEKFIKKNSLTLFLCGLLLISSAFFFHLRSTFMFTIGFSLLYLGFGMILMVFIIHPKVGLFLDKAFGKKLIDIITVIGVYSYGIYLFHMFIIRHFLPFIENQFHTKMHFRIEFIIYFISSILFGIILSKMVEVPFLKIRERTFPKNMN